MSLQIEPIFAALFAKLNTAPSFQTFTRRLKTYADAGPEDQPMLYQSELGFKASEDNLEMPQVYTLKARIFGFCYEADQVVDVHPQINDLISEVIATIAPTDRGAVMQTLGGLCFQCRVSGEVTIAEGIDGQSEFQIPIEITVPQE